MKNHNSRTSLFGRVFAFSMIALGCGLCVLCYSTCTAGEYTLLDPLPPTPYYQCSPGESRRYYPPNDNLSYGTKSNCTPGLSVCEIADGGADGGRVWVDKAQPAPNPSPETCNGKDDDCNGLVDDVQTVGTACPPGQGYCLTNSVYRCPLTGGALECFPPLKSVLNSNRYYSYPYIDSAGSQGWDWDCQGSPVAVTPITCLQSSLNGSQTIDTNSSQFSMACKASGLPITVMPWSATFCQTPCGALNIPYFQYATQTASLPTSGSTPNDCGKIYPIIKCSPPGSGTICVVSSDSLIVLCK